jgi:hypothetical protein
MKKNAFTDKDAENLTKLLNLISQKGEFNLKVNDVIQLFGLLAWAQKELLPKINEHVFEVKELVKMKQEEESDERPAES